MKSNFLFLVGLYLSGHCFLYAQSDLKVILYDEENFKGNSAVFDIGEYEFIYGMSVENDAVKSVKVPKGLKVVLYEHGYYEGQSLTFTEDAKSLGKFNNQLSSLIVSEDVDYSLIDDAVVVFLEADFQGKAIVLETGIYNIYDLENDMISSLHVPKNFKVVAHSDANGRGNAMVYTQSMRNLGNFDNAISGLVILDLTKSAEDNFSDRTIFDGCAVGDEYIVPDNEEYEKEVLRLSNIERKKEGLPPMTWDDDLALAARYHAYDMYSDMYFEHDSHDRIEGELSTVCGTFDRISAFKEASAENIYFGETPADGAVVAWMNSPGHRANIMSPGSAKLGVGYYKGYYVQVFAGE